MLSRVLPSYRLTQNISHSKLPQSDEDEDSEQELVITMNLTAEELEGTNDHRKNQGNDDTD